MNCERVHLWEKRKADEKKNSAINPHSPRRYCQKLLVNPSFEEARWCAAFSERYLLTTDDFTSRLNESTEDKPDDISDLFLTVLNLEFPGNYNKNTHPRSCFKYKTQFGGSSKNHRMFVKETVDKNDTEDEELGNESEYTFDEYVNDFLNNETSRATTSLTDYLLNNPAEHCEETENDIIHEENSTNNIKIENEIDSDSIKPIEENYNTTVKYQSDRKRKSLTISRAQSPESIQVIRVDVVRNYSGRSSVVSNFISDKKENKPEGNENIERIKERQFEKKYILTNTVKQLDQSIAGGEKVTFLCKTYKLASRVNQRN